MVLDWSAKRSDGRTNYRLVHSGNIYRVVKQSEGWAIYIHRALSVTGYRADYGFLTATEAREFTERLYCK